VQKTLEAMNIDFSLENTPDGVLFWMDLPAY
jgi:two-component system sensor histidine kinase VanS